ncbi:heavy metal efflux pump, CzcA family [gut metagenome]|uniref:Heavy metal efflux pump, CzcA family n=1 Tax=gut metagenome TaxID=749906 RepID=J9GID0_9ZZZZ
MLNKLIAYSLKNRPMILLATLLILIGGCWTAWRMEVDVFPDLTAPTVVVMTEAPGMATEEVEQLVSFPIETAVNGATDVRRVRSNSTNGFSIVWVEFDWGTDIYNARQTVSEKLATIADILPDGANKPSLAPQSSILGEVMFIGITADSTQLMDLRTMAEWTIRPRLLSTGGVAQVTIMGGDVKEYQIQLSPEKMRHYGVTLGEVQRITGEMNRNATGGILYEYGNEYIVRGLLMTTDIDEIGQAVVKRNEKGHPILLKDIATVTIGPKVPRVGVAAVDGKPGVLVTVTKQPSTSTLELTEQIDKAVVELKQALPADVKMHTNLYRQQEFIDASISNIQKSLVEGAIFVTLVLFIFLMNARTTMISLVTIPLSLLVTIITLKLMGMTMNTMSIGGMAIAIGSLVDDAIVDVENVFKRLRQNRSLPEDQRKPNLQVIFDASREVRMPILNSTLIIIVSFLPLFFLSGMEGRMLVPLGIAFIVALFASTLVALTLTPVLCSYLLTNPKDKSTEPRWVTALKTKYSRLLSVTLCHEKIVLGSVGVMTVGALLLFFTFGRSFLPPFNEGSMTINISSLPGISLEESDRIGRQAEAILQTIPEVNAVARKTGRAELDAHARGVNSSEFEVPYTLKDRSKEEMKAEIREKLQQIPGISMEIGQPISHRIDAMLSGTSANIAIKIFGPDLNQLQLLAKNVQNAVADVEGLADLIIEQQMERPQLVIRPRRTQLAAYGISLPEFSSYVRTLLGGEVVSQIYDGGKSFDLTLKVADQNRASIDDIKNLMIDTGDGKKIPFEVIADITSSAGPNAVSRENAQRKIVVSANVTNRDLRSVVTDIQEEIKQKVEMPEDYHIEYGGQFESEETASRILLLLSIVSICIMLLLLYQQFHSWRQAIIVLLNLPLALIGGVVALGMTSGVVSIPATIGFISLFGIATRGGMLLVDHYNELQRRGLTKEESILHGSADRLLPIIMTALTSALALIPLAVGSQLPGNEIQSPMAQVMLGGLFTSTLLNLLVIPIIYNKFISKVK